MEIQFCCNLKCFFLKNKSFEVKIAYLLLMIIHGGLNFCLCFQESAGKIPTLLWEC